MARKHADIDAIELDAPDREADGGFQRDGLFVFDAEPMVRNWPVKVRVPAEGGSFVHHQVRMDFAWLDLAGYERLVQDVTEYAKANPESGQAGGLGAPGDPLLPVVQGWSGIGQAKGGELVYSEAAKAQLLARPTMRAAIFEALWAMVAGIAEKNSETPRDAGQPLSRSARRATAKKLAKALKATD